MRKGFEIVLGWLMMATTALAGTQVNVLTYYDFLPWYDSHDQTAKGLTLDLAQQLTIRAKGQFVFQSEYVPRKRLDLRLAEGDDVFVVAFVSPRFFNDERKTRYWWSAALLEDVDYVLSRINNPINYQGPDSLIGKRFSAVLGHQYPDLEPLMASGKINREDAPGIHEAALKVLMGRNVDFAFANRSSLYFWKIDVNEIWASKAFYLAPEPHTPLFTRHVLVPKWMKGDQKMALAIYHFIEETVPKLNHDAAWHKILSQYGQISSLPGHAR